LIYPNPCQGDLTISRVDSSLGLLNFKIINIYGKTVLTDFLEEGVSSKHFLLNMNPGVYIMHFPEINTKQNPALKIIVVK